MQGMQRGVAWGGIVLGLAVAAAMWAEGLRAWWTGHAELALGCGALAALFIWLDRIRWGKRLEYLRAFYEGAAPAGLARTLAWAQRTSWVPSVLAVGLYVTPGLAGRIIGVALLILASLGYGQVVRWVHARQGKTTGVPPSNAPWL